MNLCQQSGDILNIVLAVCAVIVSSFLCVFFFYAISLLKRPYNILGKLDESLDEVKNIIIGIKEKTVSHSFISDLVGQGIATVIKSRQAKKPAAKKTKKTK